MESLVQPERQFTSLEKVEELEGHLDIPDRPDITTGYADIYHGIWKSPQGELVEVAIKEFKALIPRNRHTDPEALRRRTDMRIKREMLVWSQTRHKNLQPLLGYRSEPHPRLISPWCRHGNLTDYVRANPELSRLDKIRLIHQAACGLDYLHSRTPPICHADIKPENVLINVSLEAALSDFGLSRVLQGLGVPSQFTTSETVKGTRNYMAGELFSGEKPTLNSDVFAFGGLILTVMSGKPPFRDLHEASILFRVMNDQPPRPEEHPDLSSSDPLWSLMRRCWKASPSARPTMRDIQQELSLETDLKQSDVGSRHNPPSAVNSEYSDMELTTPCATPRGGILSLLPLDPESADKLSSDAPDGSATSNLTHVEGSIAAQRKFKSLRVGSKVIPVIGRYIGAAADLGLSVAELIHTTEVEEGTVKNLGINLWSLAILLESLEEEKWSPRQRERIAACIAALQKEFRCIHEKVEQLELRNSSWKDMVFHDTHGPIEFKGKVQKVLDEIQFLINLHAASLISEMENTELQAQHRLLLDRLGDGKYGAQGNAIEDVICMPGTRVRILKRIDDAIRNRTIERVMWIHGMAGRGKSTIASTVAHNWKYRAACAIFHFRRGQPMLNRRMICALARQLGNSMVPEVKNAVLESLRENGDIADSRLTHQFTTLFVAPFTKLKNLPYPILIIVDALDECESVKDAVDFVKLIDRYSSSFPPGVKFLLTCRPEAPLLRTLEPRSWPTENLDSAPDVYNDLEQFIKQTCAQIREDHILPEAWPSSEDVRRLVTMSQGLFQWAHTAITYVGDGSPVNRMRGLLKQPSTWTGIDDLYHQILSKAFDHVSLDPMRRKLLCWVLGTLVVSPGPISLEIIVALYGDTEVLDGATEDEIIELLHKDILPDLKSLLFLPPSSAEPMRLMHTSIRDLLVSKERSGNRSYHIDTVQYHQQLAIACLRIMLRDLTQNICNLSDLSKVIWELADLVEREVPKTVQYCCQVWSLHLTEGVQWPGLATGANSSQLADFERFSKEKLLCWLEVMSMIGAAPEAIFIAKKVHQWLLRSPADLSGSNSLNNLWNDAQRFITEFLGPIAFGPLHIYASALPHCPPDTELWACYHTQAKVRVVRGLQSSTWPANRWTRAVDSLVLEVAFSKDSFLASVSTDGLVRLWDTETGTVWSERTTKHGYRPGSSPVAFSPDYNLLASSPVDKEIRIWNTQHQRVVGRPMTGHRDKICSLAFSPDGTMLASGSDDHTIRVWDTRTGRAIGEPLEGHWYSVKSLSFSPDGTVLASGSFDHTIRLWDTRTWRTMGKALISHNDVVLSVAWSPDGRLLASASADETVRLWDTQIGRRARDTLEGHTGWVYCVAFSPDGKLLASGADDMTIRLWNSQTGTAAVEPLRGHSEGVESIAFSPDGTTLVSSSWDLTVRLWDIQTSSELLTAHSDPIYSVAFSPCDKVLASGGDMNVQLWDTQTGRAQGEPMMGHSEPVECVMFSPDGKILASGSQDMMIRLWNTHTGSEAAEPLTGHENDVYCLAFSPDSAVLASGSWDGTIRLWDTRTWSAVGKPLVVPSNKDIDSITFSPDGIIVVAHINDGRSFAWDVQTFQECNLPSSPPRHEVAVYHGRRVILPYSRRILWLPSQYWGQCEEPPKITFFDGKLAIVVDHTLSILDISSL